MIVPACCELPQLCCLGLAGGLGGGDGGKEADRELSWGDGRNLSGGVVDLIGGYHDDQSDF